MLSHIQLKSLVILRQVQFALNTVTIHRNLDDLSLLSENGSIKRPHFKMVSWVSS